MMVCMPHRAPVGVAFKNEKLRGTKQRGDNNLKGQRGSGRARTDPHGRNRAQWVRWGKNPEEAQHTTTSRSHGVLLTLRSFY
ncbi:hypothetical protein NDU88_006754 [Pleurodeles waltl]|uniref:Uncharacterized protein n=1 Tax=Pleurodeles waltl TaxID=8319 RepID=A0AAV7PS59_PLEWA|nr:hypothetical protein NDU88_006754 [Pleurodeles waltl]